MKLTELTEMYINALKGTSAENLYYMGENLKVKLQRSIYGSQLSFSIFDGRGGMSHSWCTALT